MPSIHVGWAVLVAIMVISAARSRWRWLALLYPVATTLVVVVTANHFWMDGIVAVLVLALVLLAQSAAGRLAPPVATGGSDGRDGSAAARDRTPAGCDRPS